MNQTIKLIDAGAKEYCKDHNIIYDPLLPFKSKIEFTIKYFGEHHEILANAESNSNAEYALGILRDLSKLL